MKQQIHSPQLPPVMPVSIIGTRAEGKSSFAAHGQIGSVSADPPVIRASVIQGHQTARNILSTRRFSVNLPSAELLEKLRAGAEVDRPEPFETFDAHGVPLIQQSPACFACELVQHIELNGFDVFQARVLASFAHA